MTDEAGPSWQYDSPSHEGAVPAIHLDYTCGQHANCPLNRYPVIFHDGGREKVKKKSKEHYFGVFFLFFFFLECLRLMIAMWIILEVTLCLDCPHMVPLYFLSDGIPGLLEELLGVFLIMCSLSTKSSCIRTMGLLIFCGLSVIYPFISDMLSWKQMLQDVHDYYFSDPRDTAKYIMGIGMYGFIFGRYIYFFVVLVTITCYFGHLWRKRGNRYEALEEDEEEVLRVEDGGVVEDKGQDGKNA